MKILLKEFKFNSEYSVYQNPTISNTFDYSDGLEVENRIYNILFSSVDRSCLSEELISKITGWPTEYHFSPKRHNLLRHFKFNQTDKILELGCGCGSVTRQLGETGAQIVAIEGSTVRAKCTALRCIDLENVNVYVSNFQDINFEQEFDYVTLIGVLEYSSLYFDSEHPFDECLKNIQKALKPNGKLIIAIENKLGLKYFNGLREDHVGIPYFGIYDLYNKNTAKTFSKLELTDLLNRNGYTNLEFQYPFPDYKLPQIILNEKALNHLNFNPMDLLRPIKSLESGRFVKGNFDESMVWQSLYNNKLLQEFSNSFLIIASFGQQIINSEFIALKYTTDRRVFYMTQTQFIAYEDKNVVVNKKLLKFSNDLSEKIMKFIYKPEKYENGYPLEYLMIKAIRNKDINQLKNYVFLWLDFINEKGILSHNISDKFNSTLKPEYIDCLPANIIVQGNSLILIDKEWAFSEPYSTKFLFYKFWLNVLQYETAFFEDSYGKNKNHFSIFAAEFKIYFSKNDILECENTNNKINITVYYNPTINKTIYYHRIVKLLKEIVPPILIKFVKRILK